MNILAFLAALVAVLMFLWDGVQHANGRAHRCVYVLGLAVFAAAFILTFTLATPHQVVSHWN